MIRPLVSVIISCFNHGEYVGKALESVLSQEYNNVEVFLIDDASTDDSREVLAVLKEKHPQINIILNKQNLGLCKSFNQALWLSKGDYIIDLAADDFLLPDKISKQVDKFQSLSSDYGVVYSDLFHVDEKGRQLQYSNIHKVFPEGDVFSQVLARHCLYASTMLVKREVYEDLNGYDESLAYEDFDFFIRAARKWNFACVKEPLMAKRELKNSLGKQFFKRGNTLTLSTLKVCQKAKQLVVNKAEKKALKQRLHYETYDAFRNGYWVLGIRFLFC